jgi:hypothetical protein
VSPTHAWLALASALLLSLQPDAARAQASDQDIQVEVGQKGSEITVRVDCPVKAPVALVWEVLTDYDHMAGFVTNLEASSVRARDGDTLQVFQKGRASRGLLSFAFENLREIHLVPHSEIRSHLISGTMQTSEFTTRIVDDGAQVHILNSGRFVPNVWVPPVFGPSVIEAETRKQFDEIRREILRRNAR